MKRGVGYCMQVGSSEHEGCEDYSKGVFLLNHGDRFDCPRCRMRGIVVPERGYTPILRSPPGTNEAVYKEVRVEYNYDPVAARYREIAIVRDESVEGSGNKYVLMSPLIRTEKRALKVAESLLANLQRYANFLGDGDDDIPKVTEFILSFDDEAPEFQRKLKALSEELGNSTLVQSKREQTVAD